MRRTLLALFLLSCAPLAGQSRPPADPELRPLWAAWDAGDYPTALEGYLRLLDGPRGAELAGEIARLTGEGYVVRELARDGRRLAVAPDGRWASFQVNERGAAVTKVISLPDGRVAATVPASTATLLEGGRVAYVVRRQTPAVESARRAVAEATDRDARRTAAQALELAQARASEVRIRALADGRESAVPTSGWGALGLAAAGDALLAVAVPPSEGPFDVLVLRGGQATPLGTGGVTGVRVVPGGRWVVGLGGGERGDELLLIDRASGAIRRFRGRRSPAVSADGSTIAMLGGDAGQSTLELLRPGDPGEPRVVVRSAGPLESPALSPSGATVAYQRRPFSDWEIFVAPTAGGEERQLTFEIQHDLYPVFLDEGSVVALKGESRHRRAHRYRLDGGEPEPLFHNNTVRTISPEYEWVPTPDGRAVLIAADRDGDTISPEWGVYLLDLGAPVPIQGLRQRLSEALAAERDLRARAARAFTPFGAAVRQAVERVSIARIDAYAQDLFRHGSRFMTAPGNARAVEYLEARLREMGYEPELQWFEPRPGVRIANVIARLPGTANPDVVHVASAHLDTVERGPGSDDDGSGVTALLEAARVLRDHPLPATVEFVFFNAEESGLLGSIEYARRALASGKRVAGVINNDMVGFTNDHRLDMTIRWSSPAVRDLMHGAALLHSDLITYDARYYKNTDAASLNDAFGDIAGGMGAYPILGNPHYHQATDRVENVNPRLVAEACKVTVAALVALASSPPDLIAPER